MRDFINQEADGDERTDALSTRAALRQKARAPQANAGSLPATEVEAGAQAETLAHAPLTHPANAEPLAELFGQLQQTHGNAYVQRLVSDLRGAKHEEEETPRTLEAETSQRPEAEAAQSVSDASQSGSDASQSTSPASQSASAAPLDATVRAEMEQGFGENFADVRLHTDGAAATASESLGARAFTRGHDIYFAEGEYNPSTQEGRHLLAHELAHVVQQKGGGASGAQPLGSNNSVGKRGNCFEQEADRAASSILAGERAEVLERGAAPAYQRQGRERPRDAGAAADGAGARVENDSTVVNLTAAPAAQSVIRQLRHGVRIIYHHQPNAHDAYLVTVLTPANLRVHPATTGAHGAAGVNEVTEGATATERAWSIRVPRVRGTTAWVNLRVYGRTLNFDVRINLPAGSGART